MLNVRQRREAEARYELRELVDRRGEAWVCQTLDVHRTTVVRWLQGKVPKAALLALRAAAGQVPGEDWAGWSVGHDGRLRPPGWRDGWAPGEVMMLHFLHQQIARYKHQLALYERKMRSLETGAANDAVEGELRGIVNRG